MINLDIISYYKDCYKEDSADLNLWNVNKLKKEDRFLLQGQDDLANDFLPRLPIPADFAEKMINRVEIYQRERVLLYVNFMVVGTIEIKGENKKIVSPLLFNEAEIEKDGDDYYFSVSQKTPEINESLTQILMPENNNQPNSTSVNNLQSPEIWTAWLKDSPLQLDFLPLLQFPKLVNSSAIKEALTGNTLKLLPISMLVFVERSTSSRGVVHELEEIIESQSLSRPLISLIESTKNNISNTPVKYNYLPGLLSTPQKKIISIAANADLGCAYGPPGTGKSYTIAAIAAEHMARGQSVLIVANNDTH